MWCRKCYTTGTNQLFHVNSPVTRGESQGSAKEAREARERLQGIWKGKIRDPNDFLRARDGYHLLVPFECDLCIFRKLRKVDPMENVSQD